MEVIIAYPLVLPDEPLSLDAIEAAVQAWALRLAQAALAEAWRVQEALRPVACPTCHSTQARRAGEKPRRIETRCGPVWLRRIRMRCTGCGRHFQPDDLPLAAALGGGHCTTALRALAAHCGAELAVSAGGAGARHGARHPAGTGNGAPDRGAGGHGGGEAIRGRGRHCLSATRYCAAAHVRASRACGRPRWCMDSQSRQCPRHGDQGRRRPYRQRGVWRNADAIGATAVCGDRPRSHPLRSPRHGGDRPCRRLRCD